MKTIGWALAATLALTSMPVLAHAQTRSEAAKPREERNARNGRQPKAAAVKLDRAAGAAAAPALLAAANLRCTPSDAALLGQSTAADGTKNSAYEVTCAEGPGYVLIQKADKTLAEGYDCFALKSGAEQQSPDGKVPAGALQCQLPSNADPIAGFKRAAAAAVPGCTIDEARYLGANATTKIANYEVGCQGRPGVILQIAGAGSPAGTAPKTTSCAALPADGAVQCKFTTKTETLAPIQALVAGSGKACQLTDGRYIGAAAGKPEEFYEAKCGDGSGFIVVANTPANTFARTIDCANATGTVSCTLTDAVAAQNQEAGVYKGLATKAGFNCDVGQYRLLGMEGTTTKREVVELKCNNTPEGLIAFFPVGAGTTAFYDCSKIGARNAQLKCSLTPAATTNTRLSAEARKFGKTCQVTGSRAAGLSSRGDREFVEVACATGPGFMIEYPAPSPTPFAAATGAFTCAEATNLGGGCKLSAAATGNR